MNNTHEKLKKELKEAMKASKKLKVSVLRDIITEITNEIKKAGEEISDKDVLGVIKKKAKQRRDSIESFIEGGRDDLVKKEKEELEIIKEYLPEQLSDDKLEEIVDKVIEEIGASRMQDMGDVMQKVMAEVGAKAEGSRVSEMVKSKLS